MSDTIGHGDAGTTDASSPQARPDTAPTRRISTNVLAVSWLSAFAGAKALALAAVTAPRAAGDLMTMARTVGRLGQPIGFSFAGPSAKSIRRSVQNEGLNHKNAQEAFEFLCYEVAFLIEAGLTKEPDIEKLWFNLTGTALSPTKLKSLLGVRTGIGSGSRLDAATAALRFAMGESFFRFTVGASARAEVSTGLTLVLIGQQGALAQRGVVNRSNVENMAAHLNTLIDAVFEPGFYAVRRRMLDDYWGPKAGRKAAREWDRADRQGEEIRFRYPERDSVGWSGPEDGDGADPTGPAPGGPEGPSRDDGPSLGTDDETVRPDSDDEVAADKRSFRSRSGDATRKISFQARQERRLHTERVRLLQDIVYTRIRKLDLDDEAARGFLAGAAEKLGLEPAWQSSWAKRSITPERGKWEVEKLDEAIPIKSSEWRDAIAGVARHFQLEVTTGRGAVDVKFLPPADAPAVSPSTEADPWEVLAVKPGEWARARIRWESAQKEVRSLAKEVHEDVPGRATDATARGQQDDALRLAITSWKKIDRAFKALERRRSLLEEDARTAPRGDERAYWRGVAESDVVSQAPAPARADHDDASEPEPVRAVEADQSYREVTRGDVQPERAVDATRQRQLTRGDDVARTGSDRSDLGRDDGTAPTGSSRDGTEALEPYAVSWDPADEGSRALDGPSAADSSTALPPAERTPNRRPQGPNPRDYRALPKPVAGDDALSTGPQSKPEVPVETTEAEPESKTRQRDAPSRDLGAGGDGPDLGVEF